MIAFLINRINVYQTVNITCKRYLRLTGTKIYYPINFHMRIQGNSTQIYSSVTEPFISRNKKDLFLLLFVLQERFINPYFPSPLMFVVVI